jgi:uroporphyrinogen-III synthase
MNAVDATQQLKGLSVLVPRAEGRGETLAELLRAAGAAPVLRPIIAHAPPAAPHLLAEALARLEAGVYEWLLLTSARAVEAVADGLADRAPRLGTRVSLRIGAVGPATASACERLLGAAPAVVPETFEATALAAALGDVVGRRVLLPNADLARPALEEALSAAGAVVERVVAYRTVPAPGGAALLAALRTGELDALLFTSGSTARFFAAQVGPEGVGIARQLILVCIGASTAAACAEVGLEPVVVAERASEAALVAALASVVATKGVSR